MDDNEFWVERLLSPHFTVQEYFRQSHELGSHNSEKGAKKKAKRVEEIYNISKFKEEQKINKHRRVPKQKSRDCEKSLIYIETACTKATKAGGDTAPFLGESYLLSGLEENYDPFISKSKRDDLPQQKTRVPSERATPNAKLNKLNVEIAELKSKLHETSEDFDSVKRELLECKKKASNYAIYLKQIDQNTKKDLLIQTISEELQEKSRAVSRLNNDLFHARSEIEDLREENKNLQQQLNELKQQNDNSNFPLMDIVNRQYSSQFKKQSNKIDAVHHCGKFEASQNIKSQRLRKHLS